MRLDLFSAPNLSKEIGLESIEMRQTQHFCRFELGLVLQFTAEWPFAGDARAPAMAQLPLIIAALLSLALLPSRAAIPGCPGIPICGGLKRGICYAANNSNNASCRCSEGWEGA